MDSIKSVLPAQLVAQVFQLCLTSVSSNLGEIDNLLTVFAMIDCLLDNEPAALKDVKGRAWIGRILKSLPMVSPFFDQSRRH
jgi:hypothetical protein